MGTLKDTEPLVPKPKFVYRTRTYTNALYIKKQNRKGYSQMEDDNESPHDDPLRNI